jgi:hypothetical protein
VSESAPSDRFLQPDWKDVEDRSRQLQRRSTRRRAVLTLVVLAAAAVLVGSSLAAVRDALSGHDRVAQFTAYGVSFRYPADWQRMDCRQESSFSMTITYLTTSRGGVCPSVDRTAQALGSGGVLVRWWNYGFPGRTNRIARFGGRRLVVGGRPARIVISSPRSVARAWIPPLCASAGADRMLNVAIQRPAPATGNWMMVTVCLRGPNVRSSEALVRAMLRSVQYRR